METSYKFRDGRVLVAQYNDGIQIDEWHTDSYQLKEGENWKTNENGEHYVVNGNGDVTVGMGGKIKSVKKQPKTNWGKAIKWENSGEDSYGELNINGDKWTLTVANDPISGEYSIMADAKIEGHRKVVSGDYVYADKKTALEGIQDLINKVANPPKMNEDTPKQLPSIQDISKTKEYKNAISSAKKIGELGEPNINDGEIEIEGYAFGKYTQDYQGYHDVTGDNDSPFTYYHLSKEATNKLHSICDEFNKMHNGTTMSFKDTNGTDAERPSDVSFTITIKEE